MNGRERGFESLGRDEVSLLDRILKATPRHTTLCQLSGCYQRRGRTRISRTMLEQQVPAWRQDAVSDAMLHFDTLDVVCRPHPLSSQYFHRYSDCILLERRRMKMKIAI
eukprot:151181_1